MAEEKTEKEYLLDDNDIIDLIDKHLQIVPDNIETPKKIKKKKTLKAILHLEVDKNDTSLSKEDWNKLAKGEKEFELSKTLYNYINEIEDWSQFFEYIEE